MVEQQLSMDEILSRSDVFSDVPTFIPVGAYSLSAHCEAELLSATVSVDSPPEDHSHRLGRVMHHYSVPGSPHDQCLTPPGSSRTYGPWNSNPSYDSNNYSYESCPAMYAPTYIGASFYTPAAQAPATQLYLGAYGVSDDSQPTSISPYPSPYQPYNPVSTDEQSPMHHHAGYSMAMYPQPRELSYEATVSEPVLQDVPSVSLYHPHSVSSSSSLVAIKKEPTSTLSSPTHAPHSPFRPSKIKVRRDGVKKTTRKPKKTAPSAVRKDCYDLDGPPPLRADCPEQVKFLFGAEHEYKANKGTNMWQEIEEAFARQFNKVVKRATLQMKLRRGREYIILSSEQLEILLNAFIFALQNPDLAGGRDFYQLVLEKWLELGGPRGYNFNKQDMKNRWEKEKEIVAWREENGLASRGVQQPKRSRRLR
ncbi:hypothetical protein E4U55_002333 [Claviceps digitariae]|nr:hypothetical protein E4U55_002333 [Claviceps digitariae]